MALDPLKVAIWRFEQITPLLDYCLCDTQRAELIEQMSRMPIRWPSGRDAPVAKSTFYLWLHRYQSDPRIESLLPKQRRHFSAPLAIKPEWVQYALALIEEEPARSLSIVSQRIKMHFDLPAAPSRSSLQRALASQRRYVMVRTRARQPRRTRFAATRIHHLWHGDAKAEFAVTFTDGRPCRFRILSIIDDCSRFVLAALIVASESLPAVCRTFCNAAARYGLPDAFYADRGSPYDAWVFRQGLALLGVRRIPTKPRNPSAHGKIEAYHKTLQRWFIKELRHQPLVDENHLQQLLNAFIDQLYNLHYHRELKKSPADAFSNTISHRLASLERLHRSFLKTSRQKPDKKTGNVRVNGRPYRVPDHFLVPRRRLQIAENLLDSSRAFLIDHQGRLIELKPAVRLIADTSPAQHYPSQHYPVGSLSPLLESYRGRKLPQAKSAFGLPEIYTCFGYAMGRRVPDTEKEATLILQWLKKHGPFEPAAFDKALNTALKRLGPGRPLSHLLDELSRRCLQSSQQQQKENRSWLS